MKREGGGGRPLHQVAGGAGRGKRKEKERRREHGYQSFHAATALSRGSTSKCVVRPKTLKEGSCYHFLVLDLGVAQEPKKGQKIGNQAIKHGGERGQRRL